MRLYWLNNDGMSGHVWLSPQHVEQLGGEMAEQGIKLALAELEPGARVAPGAVDAALARASREPRALDDVKLWQDWLVFLEGAAANGGLVVG
ncbi:MAG TPA: hypothetical protein VE644_10475 [Gaiellaceae bacterium]|nr:hypothetical protein [Gaiellaceae bacterium]